MFPDGYLVEERIGCNVEAASKKRVLEQLGQRLADAVPDLNQDLVFDALLERERLGSTGLGKGIALPHARMPQISEALAAFIQLPEGIDFDAIDNQPVDLAFAMLVPEEATDEHLQLLAKLAQMFDDQAFCATLREATTAHDLYQLIQQREAIISA
ncbi:MAG: PTS IIA-like nitrogen regulatory protein PtsN [Candidatus Thiodiazotropha sp.]|nr:PTS IIA-like nitrogen regulatory protein PtsN [Candidatus Thiodiazotropha taylori]MBT3060668.1 PTS IIA-like nitrogen regulatory protein PtsN [Candidatus Thiodiazotropha sp. (ex Lucina pensylvanica)]MBV2095340.1 PTS IIA-like nitrogen regulatory protein PtsN [Candidatus Thiodiazotropha sp. (ex Codakia orbicularis)]PUB78924.1 MAG: PTS IIA-like nitrogen-regulatory protein PtsN [gamma proteobacterium symbiont of Ctena orbiculata]MBT3064426.1 PTS IIA-like nitrogen regulatory protein PtsN [Candidat